jgi:hypothetical protein
LGHCVRRLGIVACLLVPGRIGAQLPPVGVPGGTVRLELDGSLETFDRRFFNGHREGYAADLSSPALGSDRIPALADADTRIGRIIGNTGYHINLGGLTTDAQASVGTGFLGLSLGLTNRISIFGRIPLVRTRVQSSMQLDPGTADAGLSPAVDEQLPFFTQMDASLATLSSKLAAGDYDANPSQKALAQSTLADATELRSDLFGLLADPASASPALPTTASAAGTALDARIVALQNTLTANLGVTGFTLAPALPETAMSESELTQLLSSPTGPVAARLTDAPVTFRGDAEVGASLTLVDQWDRGAHRGGFRAALSGLVRLPTGNRERPDRPLDIGTGEGQTDIQVDLVTDMGAGSLGARLNGSYVRQLPSNILTRVASPSQPFAGPDRLATVRRNPGDILAIGIHPFYRLARTLGLTAGLDHWSRGSDQVSYVDPVGGPPGVDASVLAEASKANATVLSAGITYGNPGGLRPGGTGLPVDASLSYERVLQAGGGRVPDTHAIRARFRVYFNVW